MRDFTEATIKGIVGSSVPEVLVGFYKAAFGEETWEKINRLEGHPQVSQATAERCIEELKARFPNEQNTIMMLWVDKGFSVRKNIEDWKVKLCDYELKEKMQ